MNTGPQTGPESELERARRQIEQLERQLAQAGQELEEFTYSVAHDLRASLRHVGAYVKIVREDVGEGMDVAIGTHLDKAGEAAAQMGRLMDGLLELSRVGRAELHFSDVDLSRLVADVRHQLERDTGQRRIVWCIAPDLPLVRGDLALLGQMLAHLLGNAVKFTRGCAEAAITISWARQGDGVCELRIRDNGVGFDARLHGRLFRVFQRLHGPRPFEGIGIGLALSRRVVERHGGGIHARGDSEKGCEISLTLPLADGAAA